MKKLINNVDDVIKEELMGIGKAHPDIVKVSLDPYYVVRVDAPIAGKVGIVSGTGSGHEPVDYGFVGPGMLDVAVDGEIFTCQTPEQVLAADKLANGGKGVLNIAKNFSGDVMSFEIGGELARAEGIDVEMVVIADDVAVENSTWTQGRRGLGTALFAEKVCGAAAEQGRSLAEVTAICKKTNDWGRSMGMALTSCTVPSKGTPTFDLPDDQMEIGVGVHGEPGRKRMPIKSANEITDILAEAIITDLPFKRGDEVWALVNGLGGTPLVELYVVYNRLHDICEKEGIKITRNLIGSYVTSLDMAGASITLVKLDDDLTQLWDAPVKTSALRWGM
jgi:phosphoenolpyruvate---glycerone phosphotransferase subunit DhaK